MNQNDLHKLLERLLANWENEVVEFKQASNNFSTSEIGKYFSALSNEANLRDMESGWLVFGVNDKTRSVTGTDYRPESDRLQSIKNQIKQGTNPALTFRDIYELSHENGRVILFEIPAAPKGIPVAWQGHYYGRAGESLSDLGLNKQDEIREQNKAEDWTAQIISEATVNHLDEEALAKARKVYAEKYANRFSKETVMQWPVQTFLDRARLTRDGNITRTAILLLGKPEAGHLLEPHPAQITWKLDAEEKAYEHFGPPFLINTTALYQRIRNVQIRILPDDTLFTVEVSKYDQRVVLEAIHNSIAHQDYTRNGRVIVTELADKLIMENEGSFFEGTPIDYIKGHKTPRRYRNPFLVQAMAELNMIDTMGYGIHEMYIKQAKRYFPLPDFDLEKRNAVRITIHGKVVDPAYSRLLIQETDLPIMDILALDRVQKQLPINDDIVKRLRKAGFIEGRKPNLHVSAQIAQATSKKAQYIRTRAQDDEFYKKQIIDFLKKFEEATRNDIEDLLWDKLSDALDEKQKTDKISNLLTKLRRSGNIYNEGTKKKPKWRLEE